MSKRELERGARLFHAFREKNAARVTRRKVDFPSTVVAIGKVAAVRYYTTHGAKKILYEHEFKRHAMPEFLVSADGKMLLLIGGRFRFTGRGIVDSRK